MKQFRKCTSARVALSFSLLLLAACGRQQPGSELKDSTTQCSWPQGTSFDSFKGLCDYFEHDQETSCDEHKRAIRTVAYLKGEYAATHRAVSAASVTCEMMIQGFAGRHLDISGHTDLS